MKYNSTLPSEAHTPVETGASRHCVPETVPSEHPYFMSHTLAEDHLALLFFWFLVGGCCHSPLVALVHGVLADGVEDPVHLGGPASVVSVVHLLHEVVQGLLLRLVQSQGLPDVGDVVEGLQLGHPGAQHHGEQVDEEVGVLPDRQVRLVTHLLEPGENTQMDISGVKMTIWKQPHE